MCQYNVASAVAGLVRSPQSPWVTVRRTAMCAPVRPLCQLFCLVVLAVSQALGAVVSAPESLTISTGDPLNLNCSITTSTGDTIHQVRWLDTQKRTLLAYKPGDPVHMSYQDPNVLLSSSQHKASHITVKAVRPEDEGCFLCVFDVYPSGPQQGKMCVTVTGKVNHKSNTTGISGNPTSLSCSYTLPAKVIQVLWRKNKPSSTVASYSRSALFARVEDVFLNRVTLNTNVSHSELTIKEVKLEDEACYTCEFHTYPDGTKSAVTCLQVYVLPKPVMNYMTLSPEAIEANCTCVSKPAAQIMWDFGGDNRTLGPPVFSSFNQSNGTTSVTSTVLFKSSALSDVKCVLLHPGLEKPLTVPLTNVGSAMTVLLTLCGVAVVLLMCLCGCLCKCFVCNDD